MAENDPVDAPVTSPLPTGHDTIKVLCRIRPSKRPSPYLYSPDPTQGQLNVSVPQDAPREVTNNAGASQAYKFSGILERSCTQEEVFDAVAKDAVDASLAGFNSTVFAYGQTGSGKTFTITGGAERYADRGIIPRSLQRIFAAVKASTKERFTVRISYMEIYNENAYDLLDESQETRALEELPRVTLLEDEEGAVHLRGLSQHPAGSEEDALNMLFLGDTNRAIAETPLNLASSRSHCIFTVSLEACAEGSSVVRRSKLHLVDLAGSERTGKTNASGTLFREATHINMSLHYLELVIVALHEAARKGGPGGGGGGRAHHIPYRNSVMTSVLRDSLGGNCRTTMIATLNPEPEHTDESISTCRFAQRVARVKNCAVVNESLDPAVLAAQLKTRVSALEAELALSRGLEGGEEGGGGMAPLSTETREALVAATRAWAALPMEEDTPPLDLGRPVTMERLRVALDTLKGEVKLLGGGRQGAAAVGAGGAAATAAAAAAGTAAASSSPASAAHLSATQSQSSRGGGGSEVGGGGGDSELLHALREEVQRLSGRLSQRDREVSALLAKLEGGQQGAGGKGQPQTQQQQLQQHQQQQSSPPPPPPPLPITFPDGAAVHPLSMLEDVDACLEAYRTRHPGRAAAEDNKALLRVKYEAAKAEAESVNRAKAAMGGLKEGIEKRRVERAVESVGEGGRGGGSRGRGGSKVMLC